MAITSLDDVAAAISVAQRRPFFKNFSAPKAAGSWESGWLASGFPTAGSAPPVYTSGSGYTSSSATVGALSYTNPSVQNWLAQFIGCSTQSGTLILMDRLWSCSGMGFAAATYTVTTPGNLPARIVDSGVGCEMWVEQYVAAGSASGTLTVSYKNTAGTTHSGVISAVVSAPVIGQMQPVPQAAGDTGVSQIISATNSATWTSGSWGMLIAKRLLEVPINLSSSHGSMFDWPDTGLIKIPNDACLMLVWYPSGTTAPIAFGRATFIDK